MIHSRRINSLADQIAELLIKSLYRGYTTCGPGQEYRAYHPKVALNSSSYINDVPYIVPDNFFRPEIYVTIDFTHRFTLSSEKIKGKRPVQAHVLKQTVVRLIKFFNYYIRYAYSYGKKEDSGVLTEVDFVTKAAAGGDEEEQSLFLNNIINFFLTSMSVNRMRSDIGSATITLRDNPNYRYGRRENIFFDSLAPILSQVFVPMLPVMIWAKGRLYKDWYFPIFDGYLMRAAPGNSAGFTSVDLNCRDSLEIARISQEMIDPAIIQQDEYRQQSSINIYSMPLYGNDHMEIFKKMFHGGAIVYNPEQQRFSSVDEIKVSSEREQKDSLKFARLGDFASADEYEGEVFPGEVADNRGIHKDDFSIYYALNKTSHKKRKRYTVSWGNSITPYRIFNVSGNVPTTTSEFSSRLDILRDISSMVYYDLYVDGWGNVQYHPMRIANNFLTYDIMYMISNSGDKKQYWHKNTFPGCQVIGPEEIVAVSKNLNIESMVTFLRLMGYPDVAVASQEIIQLGLLGSYTDMPLLQRFGYRRANVENKLFNSNPEYLCSDGKTRSFMDLAAEALLKYSNSELYTLEANIIFRPELELAMPIFMPDSKEVFYLHSINHSVTIGGDANTTVSCNFGRKDKDAPPDMYNYIVASQTMRKFSGKKLVTIDDPLTGTKVDISPLPPKSEFPVRTDKELGDRADVSFDEGEDIEDDGFAFGPAGSEETDPYKYKLARQHQLTDTQNSVKRNE